MAVVRTFLLVSLLGLVACQSAPSASSKSSLYKSTLQQLPAPAALPRYAELYASYLADGGAITQVNDWREFQSQLQKTDFAQCQDLPWQQHLPAQLLNLTFYRYAIACFTEHQQQDDLQRFVAYRDYVRQGILSTGNGRHNYSAWQINTFADAAELTALAGLQVQDFQAQLAANGNALYYSVQAYNPKTNTFVQHFFDNQRFLHAVEQVPFPFVGMFDGWQEQTIPQNANSSAAMSALMGYVQLQQQKPADAEKWYLKAIEAGSLEATVLLDQLAMKHPVTTDAFQIQEFLNDAADRQYVPAMQWLLYRQLIASKEQDPLKSIQAKIDITNQMSAPGFTESMLARYLLNGQFAKANPQLGLVLMQRAADAGDLAAAAYVPVVKKEAGQLSKGEMLAPLKQAADAGSTEASYLYASELMQQQQPSAADKQQMFHYLQQAQTGWHPEAFFLLGYGYEMTWFGDTAQEQQVKALDYYRRAAERFYPRAMFRLGNAYRLGELVPKDPAMASQWFLLCSRQGHVGCAFNAAVMYDDGEGVAKDQVTAFRLFSYAAQQGYIPATNRLALLYLFGLGTEANVSKALQLFKQAADSGNVSANYYLGWLYFDGTLVPRDFSKAKYYLEHAKGHPKAPVLLRQIAEQAASSPR